jgi:hypothetical protein
MKIIRDCSVHVAIGAVLNGDHALTEKVKLISRKLVDDPDYQSPLENQLRFSVFAAGRKWIADSLGFSTGMSVVVLDVKEVGNLKSPFEKFSMKAFAKKYAKAHKAKSGFTLKGVKKTKSDVAHVFALVKQLEKQGVFPSIHKALVRDDMVVDGTHRLLAYYWTKKIRKADLPDIMAYHWKTK